MAIKSASTAWLCSVLIIGFHSSALADESMVNAIATGRDAWKCVEEPIIYPGWWDQRTKNLPAPGDQKSTDGTRTAGPAVIKLGRDQNARYVMYYMGEAENRTVDPNVGHGRILRAEASPSTPTIFRPAGIALDFWGPVSPQAAKNGISYGTTHFRLGAFYGAVQPALDELGEPARSSDGSFLPWFMYFATAGNNTGVAISRDGGHKFDVIDEASPIFPFEVFTDPANPNRYRRHPIESQNKLYDQSGSGSAASIRSPDGRYHLFYTARMWNHYTLDDLGISANQVLHRDGHIPDQGIAYAESLDGIKWKRRSARALRATSPAAQGVGRLVEPRFHNTPNGEFEYSLTRPMIFEDGVDPTTGSVRYRMLVSSHSSTYRVRSLHSIDLINWHWDPSPRDGLFGLGKFGSFDDQSTAYASCIREQLSGMATPEYRCWYTGNRFGHVSAGKTGIGYCSMPVGAPWYPKLGDSPDSLSALKLLNTIRTAAADEQSQAAAIALVEATAKIRSVSEARKLVSAFERRFPKDQLQEKLAAACADIGDFECAFEEAKAIPHFNWRARALSQIASAYAEKGDKEEARRRFADLMLLASQTSESYRDALLAGLLNSANEFGFFDIALRTIQSIRSPNYKAQAAAMTAVAASLAGADDVAKKAYSAASIVLEGRPQSASNDLWQWTYSHAALAAAAQERSDERDAMFALISDESTREWTAAKIAAIYHKRIKPEQALKWEKQIRSPARAAWLPALIAETYLKKGECEEALRRINGLESISWRSWALLAIAQHVNRTRCMSANPILHSIEEAAHIPPTKISPEARTLITTRLATALWELRDLQ